MKFEKEVIKWANNKDLIEYGNPYAQYAKFMEEGNEVLVAINKVDALLKEAAKLDIVNKKEVEAYRVKDKAVTEELQDAFGDTLVTLIILSAQYGMQLEDCLEVAYNEIKNRTGKTVGGTFVKD